MVSASLHGSGTCWLAFLLGVALSIGCSSKSPTEPDTAPSEAVVEFQLYELVVAGRRERAVHEPLELDPGLSEAARRHSAGMRDVGTLSHRGPAGDRVGDRLSALGVDFRTAAENIAVVRGSPAPATAGHEMLMRSSAHRSNALSSQFDLVGIGVAKTDDTYWITQVFVGR